MVTRVWKIAHSNEFTVAQSLTKDVDAKTRYFIIQFSTVDIQLGEKQITNFRQVLSNHAYVRYKTAFSSFSYDLQITTIVKLIIHFRELRSE